MIIQTLKYSIILMRPHQYVKNILIFFPLFFSRNIFDAEKVWITFVVFTSFCLCASSIYIINDLFDAQNDRLHPLKKSRPIASGHISKRFAVFLCLFLFAASAGISYFIHFSAFFIIISYFFLNFFYSLSLKHVAIVDIVIIAIGFLMRIIAGAMPTNVYLSEWIIVMTFLMSLFIALAKRRDDVILYIDTGNKPRQVIDGYNLDFLNVSMSIMIGVTIVSYIMYTISAKTIERFHTDKLYITAFFVILGFLRYLKLTLVLNKSGSPTQLLITDRFLQLCIGGWVLMFGILIYWDKISNYLKF